MRQTIAAVIQTGHMYISPDAIWVTELFFSSFFCILKAIVTQSENSSCGLLCSTNLLSLKNCRL